MRFTAPLALAAALALGTAAHADATKYTVDASHAQVLFSYDHAGFSTTYNMFSGFGGEIMFDAENPGASSVSVSMPVMSLFTGWEARFNHFMADDFFGAKEGDMITFTSTGIEVTGEDTGKITGDLTINGMTKPVTLDAKLNKSGTSRGGNPLLGFDATASFNRSDFGLGLYAPIVGDEISVTISLEAEDKG